MHPHAQLAAEGAEAAAGQGKFWPMHDQLLDHQSALTAKDLIRMLASSAWTSTGSPATCATTPGRPRLLRTWTPLT